MNERRVLQAELRELHGRLGLVADRAAPLVGLMSASAARDAQRSVCDLHALLAVDGDGRMIVGLEAGL